jgi:peptidoglycan/xylan/chitin deacetylase (PgdA/CDA1 family)
LELTLGSDTQPAPKLSAKTLHGGRTVVSLTFDDGWADQYMNARSILAARGMRATFYVNSNRIGTLGFLTWAQLEALRADGHEIGGHTLDHVDITKVSEEEARRQVGDDRATLLERGFDVQSFAYPYGEHTAITRSIVDECGYASGRRAWGLRDLDAVRHDSRLAAGSIQPADRYAIPTACCVRSSTPLAVLQDRIVRAENGESHGWLPLVLHRVSDESRDNRVNSISPTTLDALLAWLQRREAKGTVVRTICEVVGDDMRTTPSTARTAA